MTGTTSRPSLSLTVRTSLIVIVLAVGACGRDDYYNPKSDSGIAAGPTTPNTNPVPATNTTPAPAFPLTPVADAGSDASVRGGDWLTLDGSDSGEGDGGAIRYAWRQIEGSLVSIQGADTSSPRFIAPSVPHDERLTFELTVTDDSATTAMDRVEVSVLAHKTIYVVVDPSTQTALQDELDVFGEDVAAGTGATVRIVATPSTPEALRALLREGYETDGLRGAFLIGAAPMVYLRSAQNPSIVNLTDSFYRELYCAVQPTDDPSTWLFAATTSINFNCLPNIWVSRIKSSRAEDALTQIQTYLLRNHQTRNAHERWQRGMTFVPAMALDDTTDYTAMSERAFSDHPLYTASDVNVAQFENAKDQKNAFLNGLASNVEILKGNFHGAPIYAWFQGKTNWDYVDSTQLQSVAARPKFVELESCSTGAFDTDRYFAGELLFGGDTLLVQANSTRAFYFSGAFEQEMETAYHGYAAGWSPAQLYPFVQNGNARHFFGDPTIKLRQYRADPDRPRLKFASREFIEPFVYQVEFAPTAPGDTADTVVGVSNTGHSTLVVTAQGDVAQYNTVTPDTVVTSTSGFLFTLTEGNDPIDLNFRVEIPAGESRLLKFSFKPGVDNGAREPNSEYTALFRFTTNAPDTPAFNVEVRGTRL